jgi:hypothetical protein
MSDEQNDEPDEQNDGPEEEALLNDEELEFQPRGLPAKMFDKRGFLCYMIFLLTFCWVTFGERGSEVHYLSSTAREIAKQPEFLRISNTDEYYQWLSFHLLYNLKSYSYDTCTAATCDGAAWTGTQAECEDTAGTCAGADPSVPGTTTKARCDAAANTAGTFTTSAAYVLPDRSLSLVGAPRIWQVQAGECATKEYMSAITPVCFDNGQPEEHAGFAFGGADGRMFPYTAGLDSVSQFSWEHETFYPTGGHGPGRLGAVKRHWRFPMKIHLVWGFCMGAQGA